jgi:hypothetical protein
MSGKKQSPPTGPEQKERADREMTCMYWFNCSNRLMAAAGSVWYCMDRVRSGDVSEALGFGRGFDLGSALPVFRMLCGLSIEVLLKGLILAQTRKGPPMGHDLLKLAGHAKWKVAKPDKALLRLLTLSIVWDGKYPAPLERDATEVLEHRDLVMARLLKRKDVPTALDLASFLRLRGEIMRLLETACPDGRYPDPRVEELSKMPEPREPRPPWEDPPIPNDQTEDGFGSGS